MQKSGLMLVISGSLIVIGLILLVVGNQIILEGVSQGNGTISLSQSVTISNEFDSQEISFGVFAIQVMEFKDETFSVRVLDPLGNQIVSQAIEEEAIEKEFEITDSGTYELIIESNSNEEIQVYGAIGPLPDAAKKSLGFISMYILIIGLVGLAISGIYGAKNRKKNQFR